MNIKDISKLISESVNGGTVQCEEKLMTLQILLSLSERSYSYGLREKTRKTYFQPFTFSGAIFYKTDEKWKLYIIVSCNSSNRENLHFYILSETRMLTNYYSCFFLKIIFEIFPKYRFFSLTCNQMNE